MRFQRLSSMRSQAGLLEVRGPMPLNWISPTCLTIITLLKYTCRMSLDEKPREKRSSRWSVGGFINRHRSLPRLVVASCFFAFLFTSSPGSSLFSREVPRRSGSDSLSLVDLSAVDTTVISRDSLLSLIKDSQNELKQQFKAVEVKGGQMEKVEYYL